MNKRIALLLLVLIITSFIFIGCKIVKYEVVTYSKGEPRYAQFLKEEAYERAKKQGRLDYRLKSVQEARKIIDFSGTSARFIDENGEEQFTTGDRVEIRKINKEE